MKIKEFYEGIRVVAMEDVAGFPKGTIFKCKVHSERHSSTRIKASEKGKGMHVFPGFVRLQRDLGVSNPFAKEKPQSEVITVIEDYKEQNFPQFSVIST